MILRIWCAFLALGIVSGAASAQTATTKLYGTWDLVGLRKIDDVSKREVFVSGAIHSILTREYAILSISSDGTFTILREGQLFAGREGTWEVLSERGVDEVVLRLNWRNKIQHVKVQFDKDGSILVPGLIGAATPVFRRVDSDVASRAEEDSPSNIELPDFKFSSVTTTVSVPDRGTIIILGTKRQYEYEGDDREQPVNLKPTQRETHADRVDVSSSWSSTHLGSGKGDSE